jgi:hypothetical protein
LSTTGNGIRTSLLLLSALFIHRKMPGGSEERVFKLDMAHMELGPLSQSSMGPDNSHKAMSPRAADHSSHIFRSDSANNAAAGPVLAPSGSLYGAAAAMPRANSSLATSTIGEHEATDDEDGTQHTQASYSSALDRVAQTGNRSTHLSQIPGEGGDTASMHGRFKKTLSLRRGSSGLLVGTYVLEPLENGMSRGSWMQGITAAGRAEQKAAKSVHGGVAFFREAATKADSSMHVATACTSRTVHGGTAHAAAQGNQPGGIFYQGQS